MTSYRHPLEIYGLSFAGRNGRVTAMTIRRELLDLDGAEAREYVAMIDRIAANGIRYSNEDFDILSGAASILERNGRSVAPPLAA